MEEWVRNIFEDSLLSLNRMGEEFCVVALIINDVCTKLSLFPGGAFGGG